MLNAFGNEHLKLLVHKSFFYAFNFGTKFCNRRRRGCKRLQIAKQKVHFLLMREFSPFVLVTFFRKNPTLKLFHFCSFSTVFSRFPHQEPQAEMFLRIEGFQVTFSDGERFESSSSFPPGGDQRDQQNLGACGLPQKLQAWYKFLIAMLVICVRYPQCDTVTECQERSGWSGWLGW